LPTDPKKAMLKRLAAVAMMRSTPAILAVPRYVLIPPLPVSMWHTGG
jgi:hypothetical protein